MFKKKKIKKELIQEFYFKDAAPEVKEHISGFLTEIFMLISTNSLNYGLELIKHLAIFNAAGLAGTCTLLTIRPSLIMDFKPSICLFVFGILLALLTLFSAFAYTILFAKAFGEVIGSVIASEKPTSEIERVSQLHPAKRWILGAVMFGSITCFTFGVFSLLNSLHELSLTAG